MICKKLFLKRDLIEDDLSDQSIIENKLINQNL